MTKKNQILTQILITDVAAEGKSIAKYQEKVLFVEKAIPGDIVDLRITKSKKNFAEATPVFFHQLSDLRAEPFCEHFGTCGGCKWQNLDYQHQLQFKQKQVKDNLERIGKIELPEISDILPSKQTMYYRNKLEYTFSSKRWLTNEEIKTEGEIDRRALGFHIPGRFDKIVDINHCYLQTELSDQIRLAVKYFAIKQNMTFFDLVEQVGFLRNLIIRTTSTNELMVIVQVFEPNQDWIDCVMEFLSQEFSQITTLQYIVNTKKNETFHDQEVITYKGKSYIEEEMEGLKFRIGPKSFYQTNSIQAYELYKITREYAGLTGNEVVYDLYTGTGTIANFVAKQAKKVVGIEYVEMAVEDARINSQVNGIDNTMFFAGDMKDVLSDHFAAEHGIPDVIITDPPRAGMHEDVIQTILRLAPKTVVYVSCNPATQARDLALMDEMYEVAKVQPVDMFPHTHHVENVVKLVKRDA
jgi:23S rRNA (uracil1939-C5)-methyltransferase